MKPFNNSPFKKHNINEYEQWRDQKLKHAKTKQNKQIIELKKTPPHFLPVSPNDQTESYYIEPILAECATDNYCLYLIPDHEKLDQTQTKALIHTLAHACGLSILDDNLCADKDSLTSIYQTQHKGQHEYIPYTNKKLNWHTDGYYNLPEKTIHSMLLHCYTAADEGGESAFMDHEIAYILLREQNPEWIKALCQNDVMIIPANIIDGKVIRAEQTGPVFSITKKGYLHMRYSARQKNIIWKQDKHTLEAVAFLRDLLSTESESEYIVKHKLKAGEGIISRNILHCRSAYSDNEQANLQRLLFRGRFYDELPAGKFNQGDN